jgi:hypothetical protein
LLTPAEALLGPSAHEIMDQRAMAVKKVQANPTGQGKQGIENLSKVLKDGNFRDFIKQRDNAASGGGMPD